MKVHGIVCEGASAAVGLSYRRLVGRTRHLEVQILWIQEEGEAVILTKASGCDVMLIHVRVLDTELENTTATKAPEGGSCNFLQVVQRDLGDHRHQACWPARV